MSNTSIAALEEGKLVLPFTVYVFAPFGFLPRAGKELGTEKGKLSCIAKLFPIVLHIHVTGLQSVQLAPDIVLSTFIL